ncbi:MAG: type II toxin-antitoxin system HicB family antitoxin [Clostridiales bacterium]|jgi:predicted RNase H-like HicB family nuclease/DNA-binding XRE family transcriptional regulator|nr:type II toxin-antitoxin system HicB family antitoxin [Clostridiales bacterium]
MKNIYPAVFEKEDGGYVVFFPDLDGCVTEGDTIEDAYRYAKEVLALHLDGLENTPAPSRIEGLIQNENNLVMLVEADTQDNIVYFRQNEFPQFFDNALKNKGYTKYQVAQILGVDKAYIGRIAKGSRSPSVDMAKRIATLLEIDWRIFYANATIAAM